MSGNQEQEQVPLTPEDTLTEGPFEDGFNIKSVLAALFIGFVMLPGAIYLALVSGTGIGAAGTAGSGSGSGAGGIASPSSIAV